jgi:hypothetical protein
VAAPDLLLSAVPSALGALLYGPAPGVEFLPYFLGLLGWLGVAVGAVLIAPVLALLRRLRRGRGAAPAAPKAEPMTVSAPESPHDGRRDS